VEGAQAGAQGSALPTIGGGEIVQVTGREPSVTAIERAESAPEAQPD